MLTCEIDNIPCGEPGRAFKATQTCPCIKCQEWRGVYKPPPKYVCETTGVGCGEVKIFQNHKPCNCSQCKLYWDEFNDIFIDVRRGKKYPKLKWFFNFWLNLKLLTLPFLIPILYLLWIPFDLLLCREAEGHVVSVKNLPSGKRKVRFLTYTAEDKKLRLIPFGWKPSGPERTMITSNRTFFEGMEDDGSSNWFSERVFFWQLK